MDCIALLAHCFGGTFKVWVGGSSLMNSPFAFCVPLYILTLLFFFLYASLYCFHAHSQRSSGSNAWRGVKEGLHLFEKGAELKVGVFPPRHSPTTATVGGSEVPVVHNGHEGCGETPP